MQEITTQDLDKNAKRLVWKKIIEDFNNSGQKQTDYCKRHGIKQDLFCYYLRQWRSSRNEYKGRNGKSILYTNDCYPAPR